MTAERVMPSPNREKHRWTQPAPTWFLVTFYFVLVALSILFAIERDSSVGSAIGVIAWSGFAGVFGVLLIRRLVVRGVL